MQVAGIKWAQRLWLALAVTLLPAATVCAQATRPTLPLHGYTTVVPLRGVSRNAVRAAVASSSTVPMWDYSVVSPLDGISYVGSMIGRNPLFHGSRTTDVSTFLVPLIIKMPGGGKCQMVACSIQL
jgi:hypothetical protein